MYDAGARSSMRGVCVPELTLDHFGPVRARVCVCVCVCHVLPMCLVGQPDLAVTWNPKLRKTAGLTFSSRRPLADGHGDAKGLRYHARIELATKVVDSVHKLRSVRPHPVCCAVVGSWYLAWSPRCAVVQQCGVGVPRALLGVSWDAVTLAVRFAVSHNATRAQLLCALRYLTDAAARDVPRCGLGGAPRQQATARQALQVSRDGAGVCDAGACCNVCNGASAHG